MDRRPARCCPVSAAPGPQPFEVGQHGLGRLYIRRDLPVEHAHQDEIGPALEGETKAAGWGDGAGGQMVRIAARDVRETGRNAQGVKLIDLEENDRVQAIAPVISEEKEDAGDSPATGP